MNILIKNANVLLADGKVKIADIAIKDSEILAVENIPETFKAEKVIDGTDRKSTRLNSSHHRIGCGGVWV